MVVKETTNLFTYWRRVVRLCVEITIDIKTGWDCQTRRTYALYSWYQYFTLVAVKSGVCIGMVLYYPLQPSYLCCSIEFYLLFYYIYVFCRSQWPRGLRRRSSAARLLRSWFPIPPGSWTCVCCECCVLSGRGLCDGLITRPEEFYRLWRVVVCDQENSKNEEAKARFRAVKIQPQWVVTAGKQTNKLVFVCRMFYSVNIFWIPNMCTAT